MRLRRDILKAPVLRVWIRAAERRDAALSAATRTRENHARLVLPDQLSHLTDQLCRRRHGTASVNALVAHLRVGDHWLR